jgi:hypothetical protein
MKKAEIDLSNISFENRKLEEVLRERQEKKHSMEIEEERQKDQMRGLRLYGVKWGRAVKSSRGRSSKARLWSDHKIRREYGLMKKPYASQWQNIIWLIAFEYPVTARDTTEKLEAHNTSTVSAAFSSIQQYLGVNNAYGASLLHRENVSGRYEYTPMGKPESDEDRKDWFDRACKQYKEARLIHSRQQTADRKAKTEDQETPEPTIQPAPQVTSEKPFTIDAKGVTVEEVMQEVVDEAITNKPRADNEETDRQLEAVLETFIVDKLKELNTGKRLDLNINVTGKIKFRFGWGD